VLEGIALRVAQVIRGMRADSRSPIVSLRADGGLTRSRVIMQIQADMLGIPVEVLEDQEATARGVCSLAARHTGMWDSDERIREQIRVAHTFHPTTTPEIREQRLSDFDRVISWLKS
jgi:glycerol kinase